MATRKLKEIFKNITPERMALVERIERLENRVNITPSIYLVKCNDFYKIGITYNVETRISCLGVGNPYPLELIYSKKLHTAEQVESFLHNKYKEKNIKGEWFLLNEVDIEEIKNFVETSWENEL
jgi:hypothetical protein